MIYRITPRENNDVNGVWMPDSHRLNFKYVGDERLKQPTVKGQAVDWRTAHRHRRGDAEIEAERAALARSPPAADQRGTLPAKRLVDALEIDKQHDIVPRTGAADGLLIAADRNPNTTGAKLLGLTDQRSPARASKKFVEGVRSGAIKVVVTLGEDLTKTGLTEEDLAKLDAIIALGHPAEQDHAARHGRAAGSAWVEKRGSMINLKGRLQRLNRAVECAGRGAGRLGDPPRSDPGRRRLQRALHDRGCLQADGRGVKEFAGLSLSKIGDLGVQVIKEKPANPNQPKPRS